MGMIFRTNRKPGIYMYIHDLISMMQYLLRKLRTLLWYFNMF